MSKKKRIPEKYQVWIDARKRYRLSDAHIQMARELGMNPAPCLPSLNIIYLKRFGRDRPIDVKSIEEVFRAKEKKKEERKRENNPPYALEITYPNRQRKEKPEPKLHLLLNSLERFKG